MTFSLVPFSVIQTECIPVVAAPSFLPFFLSSSLLFVFPNSFLKMGLAFAGTRTKLSVQYGHRKIWMWALLHFRKSRYFPVSEIAPIYTQPSSYVIWGNSRRWEHNCLYHGSTSSILLWTFLLLHFALKIYSVNIFYQHFLEALPNTHWRKRKWTSEHLWYNTILPAPSSKSFHLRKT